MLGLEHKSSSDLWLSDHTMKRSSSSSGNRLEGQEGGMGRSLEILLWDLNALLFCQGLLALY